MLHMTRFPKAALMVGVALLLLVSVAVAQWSGTELDEQYQSNWVSAMDDALGDPTLSEHCRKAIQEARDGLEFARTTGGIWWCDNCGAGPGYGDVANLPHSADS